MTSHLEIDTADGAVATMTTVSSSVATASTVASALRADWEQSLGSTACAIHVSLSGDSVVALSQWKSREQAREHVRQARLRPLRINADVFTETRLLALQALRPGALHTGGAFSLRLDSAEARPALIAVFDPTVRGREALLRYLGDASVRFKNEVEGWVGAALYCEEESARAVEYLQFAGMQGLSQSQASPLIGTHQEELRKFGTVGADVYRVVHVCTRLDRRGD